MRGFMVQAWGLSPQEAFQAARKEALSGALGSEALGVTLKHSFKTVALAEGENAQAVARRLLSGERRAHDNPDPSTPDPSGPAFHLPIGGGHHLFFGRV